VDIDHVRPGALPITTMPRSALDIATGADLAEAVVGLDALLHDRLITGTELRAALKHRSTSWGSRRAARAIALADGRAESPQESRLRVILTLAGLPPTAVQHEIRHRGRFVARVDLAYPEHRLAVEYDGEWHGRPGELARDRRRSRQLLAANWRVIGVTAADLHQPAKVVEQITELLGG
jgi:very-short-patch-repair endonuclease